MAARLAALVIVGALVAGALGCGDAADSEPAAPDASRPVAPMEEARWRAALAGVDWMTTHWREMPPGWAYANLSRLARVVPEGPRARSLATALRDDAAGTRHHAVPRDLDDPAILESERLMPILAELARRKEAGAPWREPATAIEAAIVRDEEAFWRAIPPRHRPAVVHLLDELGLRTRLRLESIVDALREAADRQPVAQLAANNRYVYALTHVVFARSRYFAERVDPAPLAFAIPVLQAAIARRLDGQMDVFGLDVVCESLASLALMGADDDPVDAEARRRIIALQHPDGSWGTDEGVTPRRIHPTFNAIVALVTYPGVRAAPPTGD